MILKKTLKWGRKEADTATEETQISFYLFLLNKNKHIGSGT